MDKLFSPQEKIKWESKEETYERELKLKLPLPLNKSLNQLLKDLGVKALCMLAPSEDEHWIPCLSWRPKRLAEIDLDRQVIACALAPGPSFCPDELPLRPAKNEPWKRLTSKDWFTVPLILAIGDPKGSWSFHSAKYMDGAIQIVGSYRQNGSAVEPALITRSVSTWRELLLPLSRRQRLRNWLSEHLPWSHTEW